MTMFEGNRIIELARQLGSEIQKEKEYLEYHEAVQKNNEDEELQHLIEAYNLSRMNLDRAMSEEEKDTEKIERFTNEFNDAYNEVMTNPNMVNYTEKRSYMDSMFNFVYQILVASVNGKDPYAVEEANCTGDCSTCGSCG